MNMEWIPCKWKKVTNHKIDEDARVIDEDVRVIDFPIPEHDQRILLTTGYPGEKERYIQADICDTYGGLFLHSGTDWENVLAWMPFPQPYDGEDLREEN